MSELAIFGGPKVRGDLFPDQNTMDEMEMDAVLRVMKNGRLSGYRANKGPHFYGGPEIQKLEENWAMAFKCKDGQAAIACNSATSGLFIACKAIGLERDDEVIVTPYSMTCSATIPIWFGAIPIFADVEKDYFCIDPKSIEEKITSKTKAIIAVDLFGQPCDYNAIKKIIAKQDHKIHLITDTAQAPGSLYKGQHSGTIGDIGVFSLNFGKHMTAGEGGIIIANKEYVDKCRLILNHGEAVSNDYANNKNYNFHGILGLNLRMTELQACIANVQLMKLNNNIAIRRSNVDILNHGIKNIPSIKPAKIREDCTHSYYVSAYLWENNDGLSRDTYINAVKAELTERKGRDGEGIQIGCGYIKPIYKMPYFQQCKHTWNYISLKLPIVEKLWKEDLFLTLYHAPNSNKQDMEYVANAFNKVWEQREKLMAKK